MRRSAVLVLALVAATACDDANLSEPEGLGLEAARYLTFALDFMQIRSLHRFEIDWTSFRAQAFADAGNAKTPAETYDAIRAALLRLGDDHSTFLTPEQAAAAPPPSDDPSVRLVQPEVGYLDVPAFAGLDQGGTLASRYHALIEDVDTMGACRWVVDLRGNTGGNMWPMLGGVGPILGDGTAGYFVYPDSAVQEWSYASGVAALDGTAFSTVAAPYEMATAPPVAVLTDSLTTSSGEAMAIAFRGRPTTRSFGGATFGLTTGNDGTYLSDGALLIVAVANMADRDRAVPAGAVVPDSLVPGDKTGDPASDATLAAALGWLETMPCS